MQLNKIKDDYDFVEQYPFAYKLLKYVESISNGNQWFIKECFENDQNEYFAIFYSYIDPEYKNFVLSIKAVKVNGEWNFSIQKEVTELAQSF